MGVSPFLRRVDEIDIYVNHTSDNSYQMLTPLKELYPYLNVINSDWITEQEDPPENFRAFVYNKAFREIKKAGKFDYVLFIDIDEFWVHKNLDVTIQEVIKKNNYPECIFFSWLNKDGSEQLFSELPLQIHGHLHTLGKSLVKVSDNVTQIKIYQPILKHWQIVLCDGTYFRSRDERGKQHGLLDDVLIKIRDVVIVHNLFRSPMEYVSLLGRGRPSMPDLLKLNRNGYNSHKGSQTIVSMTLEHEPCLLYKQIKKALMSDQIMIDALAVAQKFICDRYYQTLTNIASTPVNAFAELARAFSGCNIAAKQRITQHILSSFGLINFEDEHYLTNLYKEMMRFDKDSALMLKHKIGAY